MSRRLRAIALSLALLVLLATGVSAATAVIDPRLQKALRLVAPEAELRVLVRLAGSVDLDDRELRQALLTRGARDVVVLPIVHSIAATVPARVVGELAALPGVEHVRMDRPVALPRGASRAGGVEPGRPPPAATRPVQPPRLHHAVPARSFAVVGEPFTYEVKATGHPVPRFSLADAPAGMSIDADTGVIRWTPAAGDAGTVTVTVRATSTLGSDELRLSLEVETAATDRVAPSPVSRLVATGITATGCTLAWEPATDNVGVAGYLILAQRFGRGERLSIVADTGAPTTTHSLSSLKPGTGHRLWVAAYDAAGNRSPISGLPPAVIVTKPERTR